jgi:uncharacterized membrane protein
MIDPIRQWFHHNLGQQRVAFGLLSVVIVSIILRISNLDQMVVWGDEIYSLLRIFGHRTTALHQLIAAGQPIDAAALQAFVHRDASSSITATVQALQVEDPHLVPLYFVLAQVWTSVFGDSITAIRSLSVVFSLLLWPAIYHLAIELFEPPAPRHHTINALPVKTKIAQWAVILVAVSPLQLLIAREARMYSLWNLTTVLSSWLLLRALRQRTNRSWGAFAIGLTLNFYSQFLALVSFGGYGLYVLLAHWRDRSAWRQFGLASFLSGLAFTPWLWVYATHVTVDNRDHEGWIGSSNLRLAIRNGFALIRRQFIDFNTTPSTNHRWAIGLTTMTILGIALLIHATVKLYRQRPQAALFILCLSLPLPLFFTDRWLQGLLPERYILPFYLGLTLVLAHWAGQSYQSYQSFPTRHQAQRYGWRTAMLALIVSVGMLSCMQHVTATTWWSKYFSNCNPAIATLINQTHHPLVISDGTGGVFFDHGLSNVLSVARLVKPTTQFQLGRETQPLSTIANGFSDRFVITPSAILRQQLQQTHPLKPLLSLENAYRGDKICLWRLE